MAGVHARRRSSETRDNSHIATRPPAKRIACPCTGPFTLCSTARPAPIRINNATSNGRSIVRTASRQPPSIRFHFTRGTVATGAFVKLSALFVAIDTARGGCLWPADFPGFKQF
ncbi:hypothetical protein D3C73_826630 [compost metagenome]